MAFDDYFGVPDMEDFEFPCERNQNWPVKFLTIARETQQAWLITFEIGADFKPVQAWLPKSQCSMDKTREGYVWVPAWLVEEKELEDYREDVEL